MWEYYDNKILFITGASGFLGTALLYRILSKTAVAHIYLLSRGGLPQIEKQWRRYLPEPYIEKLHDKSLVTIIQGDVTEPYFGQTPQSQSILRLQESVDVIIHAASSISLTSRFGTIVDPVIRASVYLAQFALTCPRLMRFVYVSTAYANAFLYYEDDEADPLVYEDIYPLSEKEETLDEWALVRKGIIPAPYKAHNFPWPYAYAKHLTERLLRHLFTTNREGEKNGGEEKKVELLIFRPSVIGPSQSFPFPGFSFPKSTPATVLAAGLLLTPSFITRVSSRAADPYSSTTDEVPADVVVDRLLLHLAHGTTGPVHAVAGPGSRYSFKVFWDEAMRLRRLPWSCRNNWLDKDWRDKTLHPIARIYVIYAASFRFMSWKTFEVCERLSEDEKEGLVLFSEADGRCAGLKGRMSQIKEAMEMITRRNFWARVLFWLLYSW
ncbi:male sterility protein-domain-containing protein [Aspergillus avenaceus]|uniref:Fatty acyl-CoA reductase n=1 Tax=Aspergillus avenaceus TaxID=36643 RepID=A0A5N6TM20_ASPAV|nr:male sterility protein-domain-containing protein [Aspergillus avenaceus]